ncbi:hydroxymethylglutaryl-CoA reductase, degradative [Microbacterium sp. CFBP 8790]|uniref:hydroxymethylglutaryl-CoA reductase, degradative n=1 Tax=unclassified Microbacterium TaxID=2609290 RepID=UPI0017825F99|nr:MULTISPECIES: hydroxymethylglutaryl-CoA reductase, degradative [unclassified Microbacterium]MBD8205982.1 hydroxymethylglutaryl-CoA reductase, degradative [Microbacterium sp. CFBP 8801]MBD8509556.1 hydroxymethylglutaryl-CoA reductase, degradative [Microbacterium sp. CFBP 8790]
MGDRRSGGVIRCVGGPYAATGSRFSVEGTPRSTRRHPAREGAPVTTNSRLPGLRDHEPLDRRARVAEAAGLSADDLAALDPRDGLSLSQADHLVENVVGLIGIPVGVATNFRVDGVDRLVPMATEEPSVVAAASNAARIARETGGFFTSSTGDVMIAQVQVLDAVDPEGTCLRLLEARDELLALADAQDPMLVSLGGGAVDVSVRTLATRAGVQVILHLHVDVRDAMGANAVNTMAEALAPRIAEIAGARTLLRILTNKAELRLTRARAVFPADLLGGPRVVADIVAASAFAEADAYRAATHNKGIMNGISAVVLATGNDTRAVEAGCHSHAARSGAYRALSSFEQNADGDLVGTLEVPLAVGLVGGATRAHPAARAAVQLLGVGSARELAAAIAAVGLAQNLAACRALAAEGIQRGHMTLHARTIAASAGAAVDEIAAVAARIVAEGRIRVEDAREVLAELREASS